MKQLLYLSLGLLVACQSKSNDPNSKVDNRIEKKSLDKNYTEYYKRIDTIFMDLDFNNKNDTIYWDHYFVKNHKTNEEFGDIGNIITISNNMGQTVLENNRGWIIYKIKKLVEPKYSFLFTINKYFAYYKLDDRTSAILLEKQLFGSDPECYTLFKIDSLDKPKLLNDSITHLVKLEDVDNDGYFELICMEGDYSQTRLNSLYVPYVVMKYRNNTLNIDQDLCYKYNYPQKNYRRFPEGSIKLISEVELKKYTKEDLKIMRNEIYADYGYIFDDKSMLDYFSSQTWYKPDKKQFYHITALEQKNIDLIKQMEKNN
jgi:hypothetical protein